MDLKARYQYTYFIYPYLVKKSKYIKYLLKLLKSKEFELKIFKKEKDIDVYTYFLPKIRDYMFSSFDFNKTKTKALDGMSVDTRAAVLSKEPCVIFEYNIKNDIQGKTGETQGIFFRIQKLQIVCFNTGICFLCIKTNVEGSEDFADILNFNYKFRDIKQEQDVLNNYDNIRVQTDTFKDIKTITELINEITESSDEKLMLDLNTERFLTYSYVCIDQEAWNNNTNFEDIKSSFIKYINILPNDNSVNYEKENAKTIDEWKYAKIGITKLGVSLFCSTADINNYTQLPEAYETKYLYTYIFTLYKKIYLKKISEQYKDANKINETRREFIDFTKKLLLQEVSSDNMGTLFYTNLTDVLETDELYYKIKNKYDILYKESKIEKNTKINKIIIVTLVALLAFNVINFLMIAINKGW